MEKYLSEIEAALNQGLKFIALQSALTLPDICGALISNGKESVKDRYVNWYNNHFQSKYHLMLSAEDCYYFRCSNVHQGSFQHKKSSYSKIVFIDCNSILNDNTIQTILPDGTVETIYTLDINIFCRFMLSAVRNWLEEVKDNELFKKNYAKMVKVHEEDLPGFKFMGPSFLVY